ncbi:penicillin-binding transpeptidase domain-containing protein [Streptomyces sp. JNUCC 64]
MPLPSRRSTAVLTALVALFAVGATGCSAEEERPRERERERADGGLGDILVDGRAVTGSKPSGFAKLPFRRTYTDGELYASVTGYRSLAFGAAGLEGALRKRIDAGKDVATTVQPAAQRAAFAGLKGLRGAAVALDAETGDIVALVNAPSFDPGSFAGNSSAERRVRERLHDDPDNPVLNRALRMTARPGAAAQVIVAAAALEEGLLPSVDAPVRGPAVYTAPGGADRFTGDRARCADTTLRAALRHACANVFARLATDLGAGTLASTAQAFGFGEERLYTPVAVATSTWPDRAAGAEGAALAANGLGDVEVSPLHLARVTAVLAGGGKLVRPRLVADPDKSPDARRAVSRRTAEQLRSVLGDGATARVSDASDDWSLDSANWALTLADTPSGRRVAVAVLLDDPADRTVRAREIAGRIAGATD